MGSDANNSHKMNATENPIIALGICDRAADERIDLIKNTDVPKT